MATKTAQVKHKTRSGCRTCKVRKVKCDERFPVCQRCFSTGRHCDGYGIWGGGSAYKQNRTTAQMKIEFGKPLALLPRNAFRTIVSPDEQHSLDWFESRTAIKLPGAFTSVFWTQTLFQASTTEPAVLHAIVALSSAHMRASLDSIDLQRSRRLTISQYITAMGLLQPKSSTSQQETIHVALISCLVFIYLELLQSHYLAALLHLEHGLNLLRSYRSPTEIMRGMGKSPVDEQIEDMFGRLYIQARLFGQRASRLRRPLPYVSGVISPGRLTSNGEARRHLDAIIYDIISLRDDRLEIPPNSHLRNISNLRMRQLDLTARLSSWHKAYKPIFGDKTDRPITLEYFAQRLLHLYHTMATVMVTASVSDDESIYDTCISSFSSILVQSTKLYKLAFAKRSTDSKFGAAFQHHPRKDNTSADSVVDIGWVAPLFLVALKCRQWKLRTRALRLLRSAPHKEGIMDSGLAVIVAEKVMQLEGQLVSDADNSGLLDLAGILNVEEVQPAQHSKPIDPSLLIHKIWIYLPETADGSLTLYCCHGSKSKKPMSDKYSYDARTGIWA